MNSRRAAFSWRFSQLGVISNDLLGRFAEASIEPARGITLPESDDLNENPLPFSDDTGDKLCEEKENNGGGGGIAFCGAGDTGVFGELLLSITDVNDLFISASKLVSSFLCHILFVLSAIKDNNLKIQYKSIVYVHNNLRLGTYIVKLV